jgi:adenylylsulfate kinase
MATDQQVPYGLDASDRTPGFAVWFTGLPASGKTTLAKTLQHRLAAQGVSVLILDSDELRQMLIPHSTYSSDERDWFYGVMTKLAVWLTSNGINVLIAATANRRAYRQAARNQLARFAEVYVSCSPDTCRQRDPKGLYAAARAGRVGHLPGEGDIYEPPLQPEAVINTDDLDPLEATAIVLAQLARLWS